MALRIAVLLLVLLCSCMFCTPEPALASEVRLRPLLSIGLALDPESVSVECPVTITVTLTPAVDLESLLIVFELLPKPDAQLVGALEQEWHGNAKKGQVISLSVMAVFHRTGYYSANVLYRHRNPRGYPVMVGDGRGFTIHIPGGIETSRIEDKLPFRLKLPRTLIGLTSTSRDTIGGVRPLDRVGKDPLGFGLTRQPCSPDKALMPLRSGETSADSVVSGFVSSALSPPCEDTFQVIATCDILVWLGDPPVDASNWRVVPSWLGTVEELLDHRARFTAGSSPGIGNIWCDYGGYSYYHPVMVIANYHLEGSFLYRDRNLSQDLPAKRTLVALHTADPEASDLVLTIDDKQVHFRFVRGTYTSDNGFFQFDNLNVDSIAVVLLTEYLSHEVGWVFQEEYWVRHGWYYYTSGFECYMHYMAPTISIGSFSASDDTRGALNIMSLTHAGVDYVADLPGSYYPEKVLVWWDPNDPANTHSAYWHDGATVGGQTYDVIGVSGYSAGLDTDQWDQDVFLHEYGHFVMDNYAYLLPPEQIPNCNPHYWDSTSSSECAYAEGWATLYSCACQDNRFYLDTQKPPNPDLEIDAEVSSWNGDPMGTDVEGAVCASLWDIFDYNNDVDSWNCDENMGLRWQCIDEIWWALGQPGDLGHFPYTVCDFTYIWAWSGYPIDEIWRNIFNAHGIECTPVGVADQLASISSTSPFLYPNYPNPFNPQTHIVFRISSPQLVSLRLYNADGRLIRTLLDSHMEPGTYAMRWDGKDDFGGSLASGIYLCHLIVGSFRETRKLVLLR